MYAKPLSLIFLVSVVLVAGVMPASAERAPAEGAAMTDGLVAHWQLDEPSGKTVTDATGHGHHGTKYGAARVSGAVGGALQFDGLDDEVWVPSKNAAPPDAISNLDAGSIALWLQFDDSAQEAEPLFYIGDPAPGSESSFIIEVGHPDNNKLYLTFFIGSTHPTLCFDTAFDLVPGRWYHFVGVVGADFNTGYLDGAELTERHYTRGGPDDAYFFADLDDVEQLTFGSGLYKQKTFLFGHGAVDDVRIYDRPLSAAEASALFSNTDPPDNVPPNAANDAASTTVGTPVVVGVLGNDSDANGDPLTVIATSNPTNGASTTNGTTVTYTPDPGWEGVESFAYTISDPAGTTDSATVTVTTEAASEVVPTAPTDLKASIWAPTKVELTWTDTSSGNAQETAFQLQRVNRTLGTSWSIVATIPAGTERYIDTGVGFGMRYVYRIRAVNDAGVSPWSNRARVKT